MYVLVLLLVVCLSFIDVGFDVFLFDVFLFFYGGYSRRALNHHIWHVRVDVCVELHLILCGAGILAGGLDFELNPTKIKGRKSVLILSFGVGGMEIGWMDGWIAR